MDSNSSSNESISDFEVILMMMMTTTTLSQPHGHVLGHTSDISWISRPKLDKPFGKFDLQSRQK
jgi:hypothetical protein